jgi:hypothetical protein
MDHGYKRLFFISTFDDGEYHFKSSVGVYVAGFVSRNDDDLSSLYR